MPTNTETLIALLILGLGTARLSALVVLDEITEPLRDLIFCWFPPEDNAARGWYYLCFEKASDEERAERKRWGQSWWQQRWVHSGEPVRRPTFLGRLLSCHKCVGVWVAAANTGAYLLWPEPVVAVNTALAASFLSLAFVGRYYR